jgi:hypothetical protein
LRSFCDIKNEMEFSFSRQPCLSVDGRTDEPVAVLLSSLYGVRSVFLISKIFRASFD